MLADRVLRALPQAQRAGERVLDPRRRPSRRSALATLPAHAAADQEVDGDRERIRESVEPRAEAALERGQRRVALVEDAERGAPCTDRDRVVLDDAVAHFVVGRLAEEPHQGMQQAGQGSRPGGNGFGGPEQRLAQRAAERLLLEEERAGGGEHAPHFGQHRSGVRKVVQRLVAEHERQRVGAERQVVDVAAHPERELGTREGPRPVRGAAQHVERDVGCRPVRAEIVLHHQRALPPLGADLEIGRQRHPLVRDRADVRRRVLHALPKHPHHLPGVQLVGEDLRALDLLAHQQAPELDLPLLVSEILLFHEASVRGDESRVRT